MDYLAISKILGEIAVSLQAILALVGTPADIPLGGVPLEPVSIEQKLTGKNSNEKSLIKSQEISKKTYGVFTKDGFKIEIVGDVKHININGQNGVELFAKAWKNGQPLGFGKDGSVEIERFRIFNPPILVDDINGNIERITTDLEGKIHNRKLKEDPAEALRQTLAHTIKVSAKGGENIVKGKVGNTTDTFYPDADPESTSHDAMPGMNPAATWAAVRDAANSDFTLDAYAGPDAVVYAGKDGANFKMIRYQSLFDTSAIPDTDTIDSSTYSLWVTATANGDNDGNDYITVVSTNPASDTGAAVGDYSQFGTTAFANTIDLTAGFTTGQYNDWTINATGISNISKTGITKFGVREGHDILNDPYNGSDNTVNRIVAYLADNAGTTNDPKLVVTHSAAAPASSQEEQIIWFE